MALLVGAAIIGAVYLLADGTWHATVITRRAAPPRCWRSPDSFSPASASCSFYVPRVLLSIVVAAAGLAAIGLGAWEWLDPQAFASSRTCQVLSAWRERPQLTSPRCAATLATRQERSPWLSP